MDKQITYYYQRGVASYLIAAKFGVSNMYVRRLLEKKGIKLRGHDITNKMSAAKRTPEENRKITEAAAEANKGSIHTQRHRVKLALSRQRNPAIDPVYEKPLLQYFRERGIAVIPQKAFSKYNVDLYIPHNNVVVEIFGGGFHNKKDAVDLFHNKQKYLSSRQVPIVIVWSDKLTYDPKKIFEVVMSAKGLTVINGDGNPTTRGLGDIILND